MRMRHGLTRQLSAKKYFLDRDEGYGESESEEVAEEEEEDEWELSEEEEEEDDWRERKKRRRGWVDDAEDEAEYLGRRGKRERDSDSLDDFIVYDNGGSRAGRKEKRASSRREELGERRTSSRARTTRGINMVDDEDDWEGDGKGWEDEDEGDWGVGRARGRVRGRRPSRGRRANEKPQVIEEEAPAPKAVPMINHFVPNDVCCALESILTSFR